MYTRHFNQLPKQRILAYQKCIQVPVSKKPKVMKKGSATARLNMW